MRSKWAAGKARGGACLNRYVTDEQRRRRPIFIATLRAGASWLFFGVALSTRISKIWVFVRALKKQPTDFRQSNSYFGDRTLDKMRRKNFVCRLSELFREDLSQRFSGYLARIGLPTLTDAEQTKD